MNFAKIMATVPGRLVRIIAGLALIAVGLFVLEGTVGAVVAIIGIAPVVAGIVNVCLIAPILGAPLSGEVAQQS